MKKKLLTLSLSATLALAGNVRASGTQQQQFATEFPLTASTTTMQPNDVRLRPVEILDVRHVTPAIDMQVVRTDAGFVYKRVVGSRQSAIPRYVPAQKADNASASFFEDFEEWTDSDGLDWIPDGWQEINQPDNLQNLDRNINNTWYVYYSGGMGFLPMTTDGEKEAFIHFSYDFDETYKAVDQDEWLITPEISVGEYANLYFNMAADYSSFYDNTYIDWNTYELTERHVIHNMKVMISTDGGTNWDELLDVEKEYVAQIPTEEVLYNGLEYRNYTVDLTAYRGKNVKLAFRYIRGGGDMQGNSVCLDAVLVGVPSTDAMYSRPAGAFMLGISREYYKANISMLLAPGDTDIEWTNLSSASSESFEWTYDDGTGGTATSTEINLTTNYPSGSSVVVPTLSASAQGTETTTYQWNSATSPALLYAGGNTYRDFNSIGKVDIGASVYDISLGMTSPIFAPDEYCFGTGSEDTWYGTVHEIGNRYEKPAAPYILDDVWVSLYALDADPDTELTLQICPTDDEGAIYKPIATSTITAADAQYIEDAGAYTLSFDEFTLIEEDEESSTVPSLTIDQAIVVKLTGCDNEKIRTFAPLLQAQNSPDLASNGIVNIAEVYGSTTYYTYHNVSEMLVNYYSSFLITLSIKYPYIKAETTEVTLPSEGGSRVVGISSAHFADDWTLSTDLPEWLSVEPSGETGEWPASLTVTAEPLPDGTEPRNSSFTLEMPGTEPCTFTVEQSTAGVGTVTAETITAASNGTDWIVRYAGQDVSTVSVLNMAGQTIATYSLPAGGLAVIPAGDRPCGLYLLVFDNGCVIKIQR